VTIKPGDRIVVVLALVLLGFAILGLIVFSLGGS
jgi:hypothetical protein